MVAKVEPPATLRAVVVDTIRDAILRGQLRPGALLRELDLSEQLEVSRGTVREALRELDGDGVVEIIPHRGTFVRELTPRTAEQLYTLRALLEPYAVRVAVQSKSYTEEDLRRLEELAQRVDTLELQPAATYETVKADVAFHHLACCRIDHDLLIETYESLQSLTWLFVFNTKLYNSVAYSDEPCHTEVFEAIASGDPERAAETVRSHIEAAASALIARMEELDLGGGAE